MENLNLVDAMVHSGVTQTGSGENLLAVPIGKARSVFKPEIIAIIDIFNNNPIPPTQSVRDQMKAVTSPALTDQELDSLLELALIRLNDQMSPFPWDTTYPDNNFILAW